MAELASLSAKVYGRVQGVLFREFVREHAEALGLEGYVVNLPDGSVEVRAEGDREKLEQLLKYTKRGSRWAKVEKVEVNWSEYSGDFHHFHIVYY